MGGKRGGLCLSGKRRGSFRGKLLLYFTSGGEGGNLSPGKRNLEEGEEEPPVFSYGGKKKEGEKEGGRLPIVRKRETANIQEKGEKAQSPNFLRGEKKSTSHLRGGRKKTGGRGRKSSYLSHGKKNSQREKKRNCYRAS